MEVSKKRKKGAYVRNWHKRRRDSSRSVATLAAGMRGFICTCNGNEKGCIKEALNILDEYDQKLSSHSASSPLPEEEDKGIEDDDDIEKQLKDEINNVKKPDQRFRVAGSGAQNCIFISTKINNVLELAERIMNDAKEAPLAKSRHLIRLVPVEITCKAYNDDIKKAAGGIFDAHFKCDPTTFCVHINIRNNNNVVRMEVTEDLARLVRDRNISHKVDLKNPSKTIVVEVMKNICCLSVINNFFEFRKYNLVQLGKPNDLPDPKDGAQITNSLETKDEPLLNEVVEVKLDKKEVEDESIKSYEYNNFPKNNSESTLKSDEERDKAKADSNDDDGKMD